jgi:hypothetical protein
MIWCCNILAFRKDNINHICNHEKIKSRLISVHGCLRLFQSVYFLIINLWIEHHRAYTDTKLSVNYIRQGSLGSFSGFIIGNYLPSRRLLKD